MKICMSTESVWFGVSVASVSLYPLIRLFLFIWTLFPLSRNSTKTKIKTKTKSSTIITTTADVDVDVDVDRNHKPSFDVSQSLPDKDSDFRVQFLREFTYQSLLDATNNFHLDCRVSFDHVGEVFRGELLHTNQVFAIRRLNLYPRLDPKEFVDEVLLLSQANHPNLTKLVGYCVERNYRFLVYDNVFGGSLEDHLHGDQTCLDWNMRMRIALGVAKALEHLQNVMTPPILHCYIEPSNVWLDQEYTPKLSAYGVVRLYPSPSVMKGSYYYSSFDYSLTNSVTVQADIYGFGIFLLELITGRKGIFRNPYGVAKHLSDWVQPYLKDKQNLHEVVDPVLKGEVIDEELYEVCSIAETCLEKQPNSRPLIAHLVTRINQLVK